MKNKLNKITPYLVLTMLILYILDSFNIINLAEMIFHHSIDTKISGESKFIDFFYLVFSISVAFISLIYYLLINLQILQDKAKTNLLLRSFLTLEFWYMFAVSNLFLINIFGILFWFFFVLLMFISIDIFFIYTKEKQQQPVIISYVGKVTFLIFLLFYLSNCYLYFDEIKYQTEFTALYSAMVYIPLLLSAAIFLKNSKNYFAYITAILIIPALIIFLYQFVKF